MKFDGCSFYMYGGENMRKSVRDELNRALKELYQADFEKLVEYYQQPDDGSASKQLSAKQKLRQKPNWGYYPVALLNTFEEITNRDGERR